MDLGARKPALCCVTDARGEGEGVHGLGAELSSYCSYLTSHRWMVYSPTKKGCKVGCISCRKTALCS
jgi:hypothetical protein